MIVNYGRSKDKVTLDAHYKDIHLPLTQVIFNLKRFEVNYGSALCSNYSNKLYTTAILTYNTFENVDGVLSSPEEKPTFADLNNFVTGSVSLIRIHTQEGLKTPTR